MAGRQKSDAPVAARAQIEAQDREADAQEVQRKELEDRAKEQEKTQAEELSKKPPEGADELGELAQEAPAGARAGVSVTGRTQGGFMDKLSVRSGADAFEGHFVTISSEADGVQEAYKQAGLWDDDQADSDDDRETGFLAGFYGVMLTRGATDPETGIPTEAVVRLRDSSHAIVTVPYEACSRAEPAGRS